MLFSYPDQFAGIFGEKTANELMRIRKQFVTPEHINDGPQTAPSSAAQRCAASSTRTRCTCLNWHSRLGLASFAGSARNFRSGCARWKTSAIKNDIPPL
ncbi:MAG: DUF4276 family protein [Planctomycetota bacterium]|nr:DUF4276 family protein [Planctomycetota bacterium]